MLGVQRPYSQRSKRTMFVPATLLVCNARCNRLNVTVFDRPLHSAGGQVGRCCLNGANSNLSSFCIAAITRSATCQPLEIPLLTSERRNTAL
jgi:hypothetical protein